jgi:serine/threonine protein phosphatase PrpC
MRSSQQDSFAISDISNAELCESKGVFAIVADGMGGMADGSELSAIVTRTMLQYFNDALPSGRIDLDLLSMLYAANENVNQFQQGRERGGSTVVAVIIHDGDLYFASVGDSRICLVRGGGIMQLTREHVYAIDLDERAASGKMTWDAAFGDSQRAALTNFIGVGELERVDRNTRPLRLLRGDRVILMSDGVFGAISDNEILSAMSAPPHVSAELLQEKVLAKGYTNQDNLTAVVFEYA